MQAILYFCKRSTLTITAVKEGYTFDDFTLTLLVPEPTVEYVTISGQDEPAISAGALTLPATFAKEYQLTARAWSEAAGQGTEITGKDFTWSSSDTAKEVIELSEDGELTVKGPGDATVTATCDGKKAELTVKVERVKAEVKVYLDAARDNEVTDGSVTFNDDGEKALYVDPVLSGSTTGVFVTTWTVTLGETSSTPDANGKIDLSDATDGQTLTIKAEHPNYDFGDPVKITIIVEAPVADNFMVKDADDNYVCDLASPEGQLSLTFEEGATHQLWATAYNTGKLLYPQPTFTWENGVESVVKVDESGKLTIVGAGTATLTVSVLDGEGTAIVTKTIAVTVEKAAAEVKVYSDAAMTDAVTDWVTFSAGGDKALYVKPVLTANGDVDVPVETWTVILDENTPLNVDSNNNNKIDLSDATDGQTLTIKAKHANYDFGEDVEITINVEAPVVADITVTGEDNKFTSSEVDGDTNDYYLTLPYAESGTYTLTAQAFDAAGEGIDAEFTWDITSGDDVVSVAGGELTLLKAGTATLKLTAGRVEKTIAVTVEADDPEVVVNDVDVMYYDPELGGSVSALTMFVDDKVDLTAYVNTVGDHNNGVTWESSESSVVSVDAAGYRATLTAKAVGTATITVTSVDNPSVAHEIAVTVIEPTTISFTPRAAVYNKDLWGDQFASEARARFARMIGSVPAGTDLTQFTEISIKNSLGEFVVECEPSTNYLTDVSYSVEDWAEQLQGAGLLDADLLPVCFMSSSMSVFELGAYDIILTTLSGQEFTTSINIVDNEVYENAEWTKGSSENLLIAKMPNITNDLLADLISDLKILKDGTHLLKDKGITDILVVDAETGNVYIKKEIMDTLEAGTYSIGFTVVGNEELLNFTVVDHRAAWGDPMTRLADRKVQYVDAAGKTSIELTSENLANGILWLLEESGGTSAWYGIDLSTGAFELDTGSRFYVQWLHKDDAEYDTYYAQIDDEQKSQIENGWIFLIGVEDASGNKVQPESPVKTYVQIGDDWDLDELKAYYIAAGEDQSIDVEAILGFAYPEGEDEFGMMMLSHFSPYLIMDELSDAEKIALGKGKNNKTGDQAVQIAVAGLGSILVLALGIMLRLLTSKKKFEE